MANLVAPVQMLQPTEERIIEFKGLNRKDVVEEGEMHDMLNLTSDNYPLLSPRKPRGTYELPEGVVIPLQIMPRYERIALIAIDDNEDVNFYYDGEKVNAVTGLTEQTRMVAINTKVCFFPQKTYLELVNNGSSVTIGTYGSLDYTYTTSSAKTITISNEDARITIDADHGFAYDDALIMAGTLAYTSGGVSKSMQCNVSCAVEAVDGATLVLPRETFIELTGESATNVTFTGSISRTSPTLDHIIEWNNRLWGVSNSDNTIYACKLGDPKNWQYFQGTSLDSYYAQQGTDGLWTGCATYSSHLIFFKQNSMCKVYGSSPSSFQTANVDCYGVEDGSRRSVVTINDKVFYKSTIGIMAYDGGIPYCISDKFNDEFKNVVGGTEGRKYYANCQMKSGGYTLLVLDIDRGQWHKEDHIRFQGCCTLDNKLYFVTYDNDPLTCDTDKLVSDWFVIGDGEPEEGQISVINPENPTEDTSTLSWGAVFGPFDEWMENKKIYSRILLRLIRSKDSQVKVFISIDEGEWELVADFDPTKTGGDFIPIVPRRCDRYSIKIEGMGNCSVKSLTRKVRLGSGGRL